MIIYEKTRFLVVLPYSEFEHRSRHRTKRSHSRLAIHIVATPITMPRMHLHSTPIAARRQPGTGVIHTRCFRAVRFWPTRSRTSIELSDLDARVVATAPSMGTAHAHCATSKPENAHSHGRLAAAQSEQHRVGHIWPKCSMAMGRASRDASAIRGWWRKARECRRVAATQFDASACHVRVEGGCREGTTRLRA